MFYIPRAQEWQITGEVRIPYGARVMLPGWSSALVVRTAPFEVALPDGRGELTSEMYRPMAIKAAEAGPGVWELNYFAILVGWLISFLSLLTVWLIIRALAESPSNRPISSHAT
jgi:hypothetical protein